MYIRTMRTSDLDFAVTLTAAEGWSSETRAEFEGFLAYDPAGCFIAEVAGRQVGMCVATRYIGFGFLGELIVVEDMRGQGLGRRLLESAVSYLHAHGAGTIFLDGVLAALPLYERAGFRRVCRSLRFIGSLRGQPHPGVRQMRADDMPAVAALDQAAFGADRRFFLERRRAGPRHQVNPVLRVPRGPARKDRQAGQDEKGDGEERLDGPLHGTKVEQPRSEVNAARADAGSEEDEDRRDNVFTSASPVPRGGGRPSGPPP